jgi:hypothetical protein
MALPANIPTPPVASSVADLNLNACLVGSEVVSGTGTFLPTRNGGYGRALYVGVAGTVQLTMASSSTTDTLTNLAAGVWHPLAVTSVVISSGTTTLTTATDIHIGY